MLSRIGAEDAECSRYLETLRPQRLCVIQNGVAYG